MTVSTLAPVSADEALAAWLQTRSLENRDQALVKLMPEVAASTRLFYELHKDRLTIDRDDLVGSALESLIRRLDRFELMRRELPRHTILRQVRNDICQFLDDDADFELSLDQCKDDELCSSDHDPAELRSDVLRLMVGINALEDRQQRLIATRRWIDGLSVRQVARRLRMSEELVRESLSRTETIIFG